jgi:hypothetical protein
MTTTKEAKLREGNGYVRRLLMNSAKAMCHRGMKRLGTNYQALQVGLMCNPRDRRSSQR